MAAWFWYAVVAAILYGAHQIFTKLAADRVGEGLGGFVVEAAAAVSFCFSAKRHRGRESPALRLPSSVCFCCGIDLRSLCKKLESDISHGVCVADNVSTAREQQVQMPVQPPCASDVERNIGTTATFLW